MDITIIGTGNMARGIATRALAGGHSVTLLGTDKSKAEALAAELPGDAHAGQAGDPLGDVGVPSVWDQALGGVVALALWSQAVVAVLARYGDQLGRQVVVDITNRVDTESYAPLPTDA